MEQKFCERNEMVKMIQCVILLLKNFSEMKHISESRQNEMERKPTGMRNTTKSSAYQERADNNLYKTKSERINMA